MNKPDTKKNRYGMDDLIDIIAHLRSPKGCLWDREQTHESIRKNFIEETYEAVEAIDNGDTDLLKEELGDVLLQIVLHSAMEAESGRFTFDDVADGVCKKLIWRHPHVFGEVEVESSEEVLGVWETMKQKQKNQTTATETLRSVPKVFPALMRAQKLDKRADKSDVLAPRTPEMRVAGIKENLDRLLDLPAENAAVVYGNLLFELTALGNHLKVDAEEALHGESEDFIDRFEQAEQAH